MPSTPPVPVDQSDPSDPSGVFTVSDQSCTTVIIGVGNSLRGDDAAGIEVIRRLASHPPEKCILIDAGSTPENHLGPVCRADPQRIVIIDAADMHEPSGTVRVLDADALEWRSLHTHAINLSLIVTYLQAQTRAEIQIIGIQPKNRDFGAPLSSEVEHALKKIILYLENNTALSDPD